MREDTSPAYQRFQLFQKEDENNNEKSLMNSKEFLVSIYDNYVRKLHIFI